MEVNEIFYEIANHMLEGVMTHQQLANYYDFLGLGGYKRCHEYHFLDETCSYRKVQKYYISHYNKLIPERSREFPNIIPTTWYGVLRGDIDPATRSAAVRTAIEIWVKWQRDTIDFYEDKHRELLNMGEVAAAHFVEDLLLHTTEELKKAEKYWLWEKAIEYDIKEIFAQQDNESAKYDSYIQEIFEKEKERG